MQTRVIRPGDLVLVSQRDRVAAASAPGTTPAGVLARERDNAVQR